MSYQRKAELLRTHERNSMNERTKSRFEVVVTAYVRNKTLDEIKKHSRTSLEAQCKEFSLT